MKGQNDSMERPSMDLDASDTGLPSPSGNVSRMWDVEDKWWADNFATRPYNVGRTERYEQLRPAYRYGFESAQHHVGRSFAEAEPDLRAGWDRYEHRGEHESKWDEIKDAVRDAWERVVGGPHQSTAEEIGDAFERARERHE